MRRDAERRLGGRAVQSVAFWLDALPGVAGGRRGGRASSSRAASSRAHSTRARSTARHVDTAPPALDELILVAPGDGPRRRRRRRPSAAGSSARARTGPDSSPTAPRTTSRRRSSPTRRARSPSSTASSIDVIGPETGDRDGHGHVHGGRAGQRQPAADDRHALRRRRARRTPSGGTWRSSARASASIRAASASSRPTGWKR